MVANMSWVWPPSKSISAGAEPLYGTCTISTFARLLKSSAIAPFGPVTGSEDFAYMLEQVPGSFVRLGNGAGENTPFVHTSRYDFNDENLTVGAAYWTRLVERYLE